MDSSSKAKMKTKISFKALYNDWVPDINIDFQIILTVLIGLLTLAFVLYKIFGRKTRKNVVALLGLCESGKTHLLSQLCFKKDVMTVTSVKESSASYTLQNSKTVLLYDVPGHDRIRYNAFNKVKSQCKALIFVIDATTIQRDIRDVAEFLYNLFCDDSVQNGRPSILIACNKQDLMTAKGVNIIKASLEKEMNLVRVTKSNRLESVGETGQNNNSFLGRPGEDFEFNHLKPLKISFIECSSKDGDQMKELKDWLELLA